MSKDKLLSEKEVAQLRSKRNHLQRSINSGTVWEMWDPPLKSEEEIKKIKEDEKAELEAIIKLLKENTKKKAALTRAKKTYS